MKKNVGNSDILVRFILGAVLMILSFTDVSPDQLLDNIFLIAGIYLVISGLLRFCVIYFFLGLSTAGKSKPKMY
ncbi:MAG: hypothetical protein CFE23_12780 [Flavobacterium sp. BFFFF1]|uniref:YgaP family membrane protein n=1 Tax=unclassified Flavobacterium TaxID=196869 RepID=UPI000BCACF8F|nr:MULTISPECIES: DUF2892 domain-containing protein [unclassified Flavobacterium]OYU79668.1 MAG: hypothetical protein CFE23_12780 [Flavobacterium sp. BFFFF1]